MAPPFYLRHHFVGYRMATAFPGKDLILSCPTKGRPVKKRAIIYLSISMDGRSCLGDPFACPRSVSHNYWCTSLHLSCLCLLPLSVSFSQSVRFRLQDKLHHLLDRPALEVVTPLLPGMDQVKYGHPLQPPPIRIRQLAALGGRTCHHMDHHQPHRLACGPATKQTRQKRSTVRGYPGSHRSSAIEQHGGVRSGCSLRRDEDWAMHAQPMIGVLYLFSRSSGPDGRGLQGTGRSSWPPPAPGHTRGHPGQRPGLQPTGEAWGVGGGRAITA